MPVSDLRHDINLLVAIARLDASLSQHRGELLRLPDKIARLSQAIAEIDKKHDALVAHFEEAQKERRTLEQALQDHEAKINKYKTQLMEVKTNKEYTAMLKEIENQEQEIDKKESRLLVLMEELEDHKTDHEAEVVKLEEEHKRLESEKNGFEGQVKELGADVDRLQQEKPRVLSELGSSVQKKYSRLLERHGDLAAVRLNGEHCGGCGTQLPPQLVVEARNNDQLITCQSCGRILINYQD